MSDPANLPPAPIWRWLIRPGAWTWPQRLAMLLLVTLGLMLAAGTQDQGSEASLGFSATAFALVVTAYSLLAALAAGGILRRFKPHR